MPNARYTHRPQTNKRACSASHASVLCTTYSSPKNNRPKEKPLKTEEVCKSKSSCYTNSFKLVSRLLEIGMKSKRLCPIHVFAYIKDRICGFTLLSSHLIFLNANVMHLATATHQTLAFHTNNTSITKMDTMQVAAALSKLLISIHLLCVTVLSQ